MPHSRRTGNPASSVQVQSRYEYPAGIPAPHDFVKATRNQQGEQATVGLACLQRHRQHVWDKTLRILTFEEGGSECVNADDPGPARPLIVDWFAQRLGTTPQEGSDHVQQGVRCQLRRP